MKAYNVDKEQMHLALKNTNIKFKNNIRFNRFDIDHNCINFTLKVWDSSREGAKRGYNKRKLINACWHAHGTFFEELFKITPNAKIITSMGGRRKITKYDGNWEDINIGSIMNPQYASEACECNNI